MGTVGGAEYGTLDVVGTGSAVMQPRAFGFAAHGSVAVGALEHATSALHPHPMTPKKIVVSFILGGVAARGMP